MRKIFDQYDENKSGAISADELSHCFEALGHKMGQSEVDALFRRIDLDGSGEIDFDEFFFAAWRNRTFRPRLLEDALSARAAFLNVPSEVLATFEAGARSRPRRRRDPVSAEYPRRGPRPRLRGIAARRPRRRRDPVSAEGPRDRRPRAGSRKSCRGE